MENVTPVAGAASAIQVRERAAGGDRRAADAFRRALQDQGARERAHAETAAEQPVRTGLQHEPARDRREAENARHVDVLA